jgi:hypothetical protein
VVGKGGAAGQAAAPAANMFPPSSKPVSGSSNLSPLKPEPLTGSSAKLESMAHTRLNPTAAIDSGPGGVMAVRGPVSTGSVANPSTSLEYQRLGQ